MLQVRDWEPFERRASEGTNGAANGAANGGPGADPARLRRREGGPAMPGRDPLADAGRAHFPGDALVWARDGQMKPLLRGDRAASAVPARSSLATRFAAWARESLLARAIAAVVGLFVLAFIGESALAGGSGAKPSQATSAPAPASSSSFAQPQLLNNAVASNAVDAGAIPSTRPELLPRVLPDPPVPASEPSTGTAAPAANVSRATPDDPVDLNTARLDDLRRLPGIGAKRAEAILTLRARLPGGRFRQIEDLLKVKGVGRAMIKRLHPLVRFSGG
jgi:competence protein ComEA